MDIGWIAIGSVFALGIILAFTMQVIKMGLAHEEKRMALKRGGAAADEVARLEKILGDTQAELAKLRDRVQVLERLATDEDRRLAGDIERLRGEARG